MRLLSISLSRGQQFKLVLFGALAIGVLATMAGRGTLAFFTTQVSSTANHFTAGDLHFSIADDSGHSATATLAAATPSISTTMSLANMKPGDVVFAPIRLTNLGSVDAKWGIAYSNAAGGGTNLAPALTLAIVGRGTGTGDATNSTCKSGISGGFSDTALWNEQILTTPLALTAASGTIVDVTWTAAPSADGTYIPADATTTHRYLPLHPTVDATNAATGDALRTDVVCVRVEFPNDATNNNWNGDTPLTFDTNITLTFNGEQRVLSTETAI